MQIAIIGYGKMGKMVEEVAVAKGHQVIFKFNKENAGDMTTENLKKADVAIEFSRPDAAVKNILTCFEAKTPIVVGTTGWYGELESVKESCKQLDGSLLYAGNFSIGINIFFSINEKLAKLMNRKGYEIQIDETHHVEKLDAPSGTAIHLANDIIAENDEKNAWINEKSKKQSDLSIISHRIGEVTGTHIVTYHSKIDDIEIRHEAHNRKGFAQGAVLAAEWLAGKKGAFTMKDVLKI